MKQIKHILIAICICSGALLSSCISPAETNLLQNLNINYPMQPYEEYRLKPNDYLSCAIYSQNRDFTAVYKGIIGGDITNTRIFAIHENGAINVPMFGEIHVAGLTIQEAEDTILKNIREAISDAQVKIDLENNTFYVLSDGQKGSFEIYKENMNIYQALSIVGRTDERLDLTSVRLLRTDLEGHSVERVFDLRTQDVIQSEFFYIQPNDMIYLPTSKKNFFNVTSLTGFFATATASLTFLLFAATYKF